MTQEEIDYWKAASWDELGKSLTSKFNICGCQRKIKTIVDNLYEIYVKLEKREFKFTGTEWLIIAMIDKHTNAITHGTNCEYPILMSDDELWQWILAVRENPNLEDN